MSSYQVVDRCDFQPGQTVNQYTIRKVLGEGSFGVVYLAEGSGGQKLALKLLRLWEVPSEIRQPLMERFEMEFRTGQINCENLVQSLDYGIVGGNPYIVMEFCPGGDLEPLLGKGDARNTRICQHILNGLSALHVQGKVHRDLKPENVLFKQSGVAALTDFGIAGDRTHRMTQRNIFGKPNQIFGTYAYMPPEQVNRARGGATVLPTTDIFSFGVLAYQLLTGLLPFGTLESHNDLAEYQIRGKKGEWNRHALMSIPNGQQWLQVIEGCLAPDFKQRLQTTNDVLRMMPPDTAPPNAYQPQGYQPQSYQAQRYQPQGYQAQGYQPQGYQAQGYQPPRPQPQPQPQPVRKGCFLRIMQGEEYGRIYDLTQLLQRGQAVLTVGRQNDNAIFIKSDSSDFLSRHHCTIEHGEGKWVVRDGQWQPQARQWVASTNGTFVNSRPVSNTGYYLSTGDIITIGDVTLKFENN